MSDETPTKPVSAQASAPVSAKDQEIARLEAIAYMKNHTVDDVPAILAAQEALKELQK